MKAIEFNQVLELLTNAMNNGENIIS